MNVGEEVCFFALFGISISSGARVRGEEYLVWYVAGAETMENTVENKVENKVESRVIHVAPCR